MKKPAIILLAALAVAGYFLIHQYTSEENENYEHEEYENEEEEGNRGR